MNGITRSSYQTRSGRIGRSRCVAGWIKVVSSLRSTKEASTSPQRCASATTLPAYRRLLSVLMLGCMAALVSAACDLRPHTIYGVQDLGVTHVGVSADGTVYANGRWPTMNPGEQRFLSHDGGLSWVKGWDDSAVIKWTPGVANTPQGQYRITRFGVALQIDDQKWERVYSTEYLRKPGNHWVQEKTVGEVVNWPRDIIFEPLSGNLIVAMGQQGVTVGTPDGSWTRYGVGEYTPSDFSFTYKNQLLFSDVDFWVAALALSLSLTGAALVFSYHNPEASSLFAFTRCLISSAAAVISVALLLLFGDSIASDVPESFDRLTLPVFILGGFGIGFILTASAVLAGGNCALWRDGRAHCFVVYVLVARGHCFGNGHVFGYRADLVNGFRSWVLPSAGSIQALVCITQYKPLAEEICQATDFTLRPDSLQALPATESSLGGGLSHLWVTHSPQHRVVLSRTAIFVVLSQPPPPSSRTSGIIARACDVCSGRVGF